MGEKTKILVTGSSGFVGSELLKVLENVGQYEVYGLVGNQRRTGISQIAGVKKEFQADISDYKSLIEQVNLEKADILIHCAGLAHQIGQVEKEDFWRVNVLGTENVCKLAEKIGVGHIVLISTVAVYGDYGERPIDETFICQPSGFYAESKLESENRAVEFCDRHRIRLTILRLATVIGEGDRGNIARLITLIDKGRFFWVGRGINKKSLIYKTDVARGILKSIHSAGKTKREIYNLTGETVSMKAIVETLAQGLHKKTPQIEIPEKIVQGFFRVNRLKFSFDFLKKLEKTFEKWLSDDIFSGKKFEEKFEFKPETTVHEALLKQVKYYLSQKKR
jgi:nucleoside-diphosphate-sugar epimerase